MSRTDPSAATGQQPYEPLRCVCGDLDTIHKLTDGGERAACSSSLCGCRVFVKAGATDG